MLPEEEEKNVDESNLFKCKNVFFCKIFNTFNDNTDCIYKGKGNTAAAVYVS